MGQRSRNEAAAADRLRVRFVLRGQPVFYNIYCRLRADCDQRPVELRVPAVASEALDLVHWYGKNFDPLLIARPPFWMTTIWVDALFFGPFYVFAIYAFVRKRAWIRDVSIVWSSALIINVLCILSEEVYGVHRPENLRLVILLNMPWLVMPALNLARMLPRKDPWKGRSRKAKNASSVQPQAEPKAKAQTGKKGKSKAKKQN
ncbi:putative EXPERA (EXPanded EBP superfamily) [Monocercomonoides exilis]|uniref:putative EXPERA (EXPanded EBP superfamily) n=1 Tax=Monocercomonoides exilis TaxID=2049356 RepID=UPI00355AC278|nr:putative EXPERA (EXPanded EBP superfamily) [Monocercomonoides exilis]|eukprot:MONOS_13114.1-p1 / transcript=MONOS_13114.1 / gene=MONOS_13114 / organism=Monocercomonoides_exilis_PA203 / gene_product=unspecified product / transcript_product=unspecified product / location=Mono_scaffold00779:20141-20917(-) / protein_length=202 / sequence_SO=supercontig / SO=protein_coding / is_pseudo=false